MRIYKMTATFGKLEQQTLTLEPGLNIITAPNEWGKSTWCAFLVSMLYGMDTRSKTTKNNLADKDRYEPWSGSPMAGRMDLNWNGRDITIERWTRRRVPLGEFRAYETNTGLPVEELTAANCGAKLLGVEQSVFRRAGFIRHADLPVTQDESLRRRLNALVTTGDDSGAADRLAEKLKTLKNSCRYNRNGLIPQAETQRAELEEKLGELELLDAQTGKLTQQLETVQTQLRFLENHRQAQAYAKLLEDSQRVEQARQVMELAEQKCRQWEETCSGLPDWQETQQKYREMGSFLKNWQELQQEQQASPAEPVKPQMPPPFEGASLEEAYSAVRRDVKLYNELEKTKVPLLLLLVGILGILATGGLVILRAYIYALISGASALTALIWGIWEKRSVKKQKASLRETYGSGDSSRWAAPVEDYEVRLTEYQAELEYYQQVTSDLEVRQMVLQKKRDTLCGEQKPETVMDYWQQAISDWENCLDARREARMAKDHYEGLHAMLRPVEKPGFPDELTHSEAETERLLGEFSQEQQRLQNRLGQYQGRMEMLGDRNALQEQLETVNRRIDDLEETYAALTIAQETLAEARAELQRRFAPRITRKAQHFLSRMTDGRYHSVTMSEDFSLRAGAGQEETLHDAIWRSDGTMDQLYLALRLAVAEELTPEAPLILDDALVRFDDARMKRTVEVLKDMAKEKQILLFTCQGREADVS